MTTEVNKNIKYTKEDIKKRRKKNTNETVKNNLKNLVSTFLTAVKNAHS